MAKDSEIANIFAKNKAWAETQHSNNPAYFTELAAGQKPSMLYIGCSDSRVPIESVTGLPAGAVFVHRNIANLVCINDGNCAAVIEYAVAHLKVKHIVVCGHYGCGGVKAAMTPADLGGALNPWLRTIRDVYRTHEAELDAIKDQEKRYRRLVELNVEEGCRNIIKEAVVQKMYAANGFPIVHGWVFGLEDGLLTDLNVDFEGMLKSVQKIYDLTK